MNDFKSSAIQSSVVTFMKKIVNKNKANQASRYPAASSSGYTAINSTTYSDRPSSASSGKSNRYWSDISRSNSSYSTDSCQNMNRSEKGDESHIINKLKQKVASKVMQFKNDSPQCGAEEKIDFPKVNLIDSQSSLTNDQLTAHLTEEEKLILQKVFQKEEEFHRESRLKRQGKNENEENRAGHSVGPSGSGMSSLTPSIGCCRTCLKKIYVGEQCNYCDSCDHPICEDCSSYSEKSKEKIWMCSFCRRRGTQPAVAALNDLGIIPSSLIQQRRRSAMLGLKESHQDNKMDLISRSHRANSSSIELSSAFNSNFSLKQRRASNIESARHSLTDITLPRSLEKDIHTDSSNQIKSRNGSPERRFSSFLPDQYTSCGTLSDRRSSCESQSLTLEGGLSMKSADQIYKSSDGINSSCKLSRKSYSASDSSLDDLNDEKEKTELKGNDSTPKRRRSQRSKSSSHYRNMNELQSDSNSFYYTREDHSTSDSGQNGTLYQPLKDNSLRHIASDAAIYTIPALRRQNGSQSSEFSDIRLTSPQADSGSFSDFNRSPRESADSEILGIPLMAHLASQRLSIPSGFVDNSIDPNHLTLKDCFPRRSSTGRALPQVPLEQSRSLLELSQGRSHANIALDLPNSDQPRRASAPEGENITIVIDDADSKGISKSSLVERIILHRNDNENNTRTRGFGLCVMGGKLSETDGKLYAYVAWVVPSGCADKMNLKPGDRILEWDHHSLVNCTYEQVCNIIDNSGNTVELLIEPYIKEERKGPYVHQRRRLSQTFSGNSTEQYPGTPVSPNHMLGSRRKLPRTPETAKRLSQGEVLLQVWLDIERTELIITIMRAKGVLVNNSLCYAQVRVLPSLGFKSCKTEISQNLEWNETLIFQNFPVEETPNMALEITIWDENNDKLKALGETVIPIESAIAHNTDWWPLLAPNYIYTVNQSSSAELIETPNENKSFLHEIKSAPGSRRNSNRSESGSLTGPVLPFLHNSRESFEYIPSRSLSLRVARHSKANDELIESGLRADSNGSIKSRNSLRLNKKLSRSYSLKSTGSYLNHGESESESSSESEEGNVRTIANIEGEPGSNRIVGDIKLGFVMTKGLLEIQVIAARGLLTHLKTPPDTYVKTYLEEGNRHTNKKKTRVVTCSSDPQYHQTLKYDAAMIYGRSLFVMVWQKHRGFEHNTPIGAVNIKVNQLELHKLTIGWYKLYAVPHSSILK